MKILVVDDDELMHLTLQSVFKEDQVLCASTYEAADALLKTEAFQVAFLDIQLKKGSVGSGIDILRRIRERDNYLPCIMISGLDDRATIEQCLELGAVDYVVKGTVSPEAYRLATYKGALWRKMNAESTQTRQVGRDAKGLDSIMGQSASTLELKKTISRLATLPGPFLILGETGTGKELVARALWASGGKNSRPFIPVNCASFPENLIESELFGYEKGAFTGALNTKTGLFEAANGGDIFLDEIGELSLDLQAKFLRVLQEKKVRRLGSDRERPVDVRIIAATNVELMEAVNDKEFREDLFYRLNVHVLRLKPLRERREDVVPLLKYFCEGNGFTNLAVKSDAEAALLNFSWPGNIRQLRGFCEYLRGVLESRNSEITSEIVAEWLKNNQLRKSSVESTSTNVAAEVNAAMSEKKTIDLVAKMDQLQRSYVETALQACHFNRSQAARILGVSRQRLSNWLSDWGMN